MNGPSSHCRQHDGHADQPPPGGRTPDGRRSPSRWRAAQLGQKGPWEADSCRPFGKPTAAIVSDNRRPPTTVRRKFAVFASDQR